MIIEDNFSVEKKKQVKLKILVVLDYYYPNTGGVEVLFKTLCEELVKRGHKVTVVTSKIPNTVANEIINGVEIKRIFVFGKGHMKRYVFAFLSIPFLLKNAKKYNIIQTSTFCGAPPSWLVSKIYKIPSIITIHETKFYKNLIKLSFLKLKMLMFFEWFMVRLDFDKYVCVSESTKKGLNVLQEKIVVIYNPVNYTVFNPKLYPNAREAKRKELGIKDTDFLYLYYGRPGISKGVEYLIDAIPKINALVPCVKGLFILGTDPEKSYIKIAEKLKQYENVILKKPVFYNELPKFLLAADCVVIPSISEGFGFCVAESAAMNIPIVASNTTSIPEIVSGKFILIPVRDSDSIAKAVKLVKEKKYEQTKTKYFTQKKCVDKYEELYNKTVKSD